MKKIIIGIYCMVMSCALFGQSGKEYNFSLDFRVVSLMQMPKLLNNTNSQENTVLYARSVFAKFNDNQLSFRIGGFYNSDNIKFDNQCVGCQEGSGKQRDYFFKFGVEKNFNYATVRPYLGFDLGYRSQSFSGVIRNVQAGSTAPDYNVESTKNGLVISPLFGIKLNLIDKITFFAEGNLDFFYNYERRETTDMIVGSPTNFNKFTRMEYLLNPVALGIQIHFGSEN